ncbi:unnamed protein product [Effrenium voratum]|uniref:Uncharacterized protein n=1 Tax=Effrenium voratum TaxID=2562239 RepID=A0AA36J3N2_9DINO|nr:unnamed protein product [Effrenium voratum]CAJ1433366.1 unnamed protein product [Effrenium voratum]
MVDQATVSDDPLAIEALHQETRALHGEVDECLASLEEWRQRRKKDFEVFEEEMGKYQWERIEADLQLLDMEASGTSWQPVDAAEAFSAVATCGTGSAADAATDAEARDAGDVVAAAAPGPAESERLAALRAEVEALRRKEAESEKLLSPSEVLGPEFSEEDWDELEQNLLRTRGEVDQVQESIASAGNQMAQELQEMEKMLAECEAFRLRCHGK